MKRSESVAKQLERYGNPVRILPEGGAPIACRAMIQPLRVRRIPDSDAVGIVGGDRDNDGMLYIGPVSCRLDRMPGRTMVEDSFGKWYRVVNARCLLAGNAPIYVSAVLQPAEKEGEIL